MGKQVNIAILGLGVVATGVVDQLVSSKEKIRQFTANDIRISKVLVRSKEKKQKLADKYQLKLETNIEKILNDPTIDLVIELIGGIHPAKEWILQALQQKKHVITANKDLLAQYGLELTAAAEENQVSLLYEASVAGGIPILRNLQRNFITDEITAVEGILNGTTNFMLTQMAEKEMTLTESLLKAQELGFAEADPTNDLEGLDVAYKLVLLIRLAFSRNIAVKNIERQGIDSIRLADIQQAKAFGYRIKLLAQAQKKTDGMWVSVGPKLIPASDPLAHVDNEMNAVSITSSYLGHSMFYGPGAGSNPTATSVMNDLLAILQNGSRHPLQLSSSSLTEAELTSQQAISHYLCLHTDLDIRPYLKKAPLQYSKAGHEVFLITAKMMTKDWNELLGQLKNKAEIKQILDVLEG